MIVRILEINNNKITDNNGKIDWSIVKNTPTIEITSNSHLHNDRYYTKTEVDNRISSLTLAVDELENKVNNLFN